MAEQSLKKRFSEIFRLLLSYSMIFIKIRSERREMILDITPKELGEVKKSYNNSGIFYDTDEEYAEAHTNLVKFFDILIQIDMAQKRRSKEENDANANGSEGYLY